MEADGGMASSGGVNKAGAKFGTGYCDAQCPGDVKFVAGQGNINATDPMRVCCAEMDIWEANKVATAYTPHPCNIEQGTQLCDGDECYCDAAGCDFNSYREGVKDFYGPGSNYTVDTTKPFTIVTQFVTDDGTDDGDVVEIRRFYVQGGNKIENSKNVDLGHDSLTDDSCSAQKDLWGEENTFANNGGMKGMSDALGRGMVLVFSIWDDSAAHMLWLDATYPTDFIHLTSSLTIEMISKNNEGGGNHGGEGTIQTNRSIEQIMSCVNEQGRLRVTPGVHSLKNAVYEAQQNGITDIFLEDGEHDEKGRYDYVESVIIDYSVSIVGESREHCIVMGGLRMRGKKEDNVSVSNLTLRGSKGHGVFGCNGAVSIHLDNVSVENSEGCGVVVSGTNRSNTMTNCNVSHSKYSGLSVSDDGLMTIDGNATTIHHNCTNGNIGHYGLYTTSPSSSIHLASSLTIETISKNNGGGGNHGGKGTIAVVDNEGTIIETIQEATLEDDSEDDY